MREQLSAMEEIGSAAPPYDFCLHWVQRSGSSVNKHSHILIFQLAWLLFSEHMEAWQGVY